MAADLTSTACRQSPRCYQHIYFQPTAFAIMVQNRLLALVGQCFIQLRHHPAFENSPSQRMQPELSRLSDLQKIADQPAIEEMQFGCLHYLLADVDIPGWYPVNDITGLQNR